MQQQPPQGPPHTPQQSANRVQSAQSHHTQSSLGATSSASSAKKSEDSVFWEEEDERYYELADALQYLGNVGFRTPVPAYKHSCAVFQHLLERIPSSDPHPSCPRRPDWEEEIMQDCALRLGYKL